MVGGENRQIGTAVGGDVQQSVYDNPIFFAQYLKLRKNPISLNEVVEKPTMFSLLPDLRGKKLLDLGCGTGEHLYHYATLGAERVVGMDLSQAMLAEAAARFAKNPDLTTACHFYQGSMTALDRLPETGFDVITSSFAFHYVENLDALLTQIPQKLVPNGTLIFSQEHPITTAFRDGERWEKNAQKQQVAYRLNYYRDEGERQRNWFQQPFTTYHRTIATIINSLIAHGFEICEIREPMLADQPKWHAEFKDLRHRPPLLFIKAIFRGR